MMKLIKQAQRHKVAKAQRNDENMSKAQRHKVAKIRRFCRTPYQSIGAQRGNINSVPVCLSASVPTNKGFSFMELMVVVAIIGMLIAASMPVFRSFARGRNLKEGANMVMSALRKTKEASITYRKNYMVLINADTDIIHNISGGDFDSVGNAIKIYNREQGTIEGWEQLPREVIFDASYSKWTLTTDEDIPYPNEGDPIDNVLAVGFKSTGAVDGNGFTITLKDESTGDTKNIIVTALTGRIRIE